MRFHIVSKFLRRVTSFSFDARKKLVFYPSSVSLSWKLCIIELRHLSDCKPLTSDSIVYSMFRVTGPLCLHRSFYHSFIGMFFFFIFKPIRTLLHNSLCFYIFQSHGWNYCDGFRNWFCYLSLKSELTEAKAPLWIELAAKWLKLTEIYIYEVKMIKKVIWVI